MMILKYMGPLIVALSIDAFGLLMAIAIFVMFSVAPATTVGAAAGAAVAGKTGAVVGGTIGAVADVIPGTHAAASAVMEPLGEGLGQVIDFAVDMTFGTGLIVLLFLLNLMNKEDLLSWRRTPFLLGKLVPFIDIAPLYTIMVIGLIMRKEAENGGVMTGATAGILATALGAQSATKTATQSLGRIHRSGRQEGETPPSAMEAARYQRPTAASERPPARAPLVMQDVRMPKAAAIQAST